MFYSLPCVETMEESEMMDEQELMRQECSVSCHRPKRLVTQAASVSNAVREDA